ncbi:helix-turn-helix domain-containing protein [Metasolibacillus meyeri]|uniref:helix-turn-helix domain-containing protein n=1 Tax=Metasolibacillus meyeri TaxID=1071052 RepID=UPI000D307335|nr:AraC family transcriptional regulator [Metasolibacillus meyeri]
MKHVVQRMIDWVEDHLFEGFSLVELSEKIGYSPYYCSFKFHQITGVSLKRYMTLRKVYLSSIALKDTNERILDIALNHGYSTQESYTRAFKEIVGVSPNVYRQNPMPLQSYVKLTMTIGEMHTMDISKKLRIKNLQNNMNEQFDVGVLNILNGEEMFKKFKEQQLMGASDYAPFNEAMCINDTTYPIFSPKFNEMRAQGHKVMLQSYEAITLATLKNNLFSKKYACIVLWFGEDMFCQMNLLTVLAYLEQINYEGVVYYHAVQEQTYDVEEIVLQLGGYRSLYKTVLMEKRMPSVDMMPVMYQGTKLYLELQKEMNEITKYIEGHRHLALNELVSRLLKVFPQYGLGDTQYIEIIDRVRKS